MQRKYPSNPQVFTPGFAYSGPNKVWEDIIPPFSVAVGNGGLEAGNYSGMNWTADGKAIYFGAGTVGGQSAAGICRKMTAKEFYDSEVAAGEDPADVLKDLRDQDAEEDNGLNPNNVSELPVEVSPPAGPEAPSDLPTLTQAITGRIWYDDNGNGEQDPGENNAENIEVTLEDPNGDLPGVTLTIRTLPDGTFTFTGIPEGDWEITISTPSGYTLTYDSTSVSDGRSTASVPRGGAGYVWFGLISTSSGWTPPEGYSGSPGSSGGAGGVGSSNSGSLPNTGDVAIWIGTPAALLVIAMGLLGYALVRRAWLRPGAGIARRSR